MKPRVPWRFFDMFSNDSSDRRHRSDLEDYGVDFDSNDASIDLFEVES